MSDVTWSAVVGVAYLTSPQAWLGLERLLPEYTRKS